jgi:hypothetical protein
MASPPHQNGGGPAAAAAKAVGATTTPSASSPAAVLGPRGLIRRTEYVRLLQQALAGLGHADLAAALGETSGAPGDSGAPPHTARSTRTRDPAAAAAAAAAAPPGLAVLVGCHTAN